MLNQPTGSKIYGEAVKFKWRLRVLVVNRIDECQVQRFSTVSIGSLQTMGLSWLAEENECQNEKLA